jgi:predicted PurR-regulated permease PerM
MTTPEQSRSATEIVLLITAVLLLLTLGYSVHSIISPFVITGALVYLLYPYRQSVIAGRLMWLSSFLFLLWFFNTISGLLLPFLVAFLFAYIINPLVTSLARRRIPRWLSSLVVVLVLIGVGVSVLLFVMPLVIQQFEGIIGGMTSTAGDVALWLKSGQLFAELARFGIPVEKAQEVITTQLSPRLESVLKTLFEGLFGFVSGFSSLLLQIVNVIIIPFLLFYLLKDFPSITDWCTTRVPERRRERFTALTRMTDDILGKYLRGAIMVAIIQGTLSGLALWAIGVNYALVLGIMTGVLNFIPYVGLLTSLAVSCIVALFSGGSILTKVMFVIVLYLSQKLLEATVLGPKIVGTQVGLHPVLLILCLLVFGYFLGFVGMLIAVPSTALLIAGMREWEASHREMPRVSSGRVT